MDRDASTTAKERAATAIQLFHYYLCITVVVSSRHVGRQAEEPHRKKQSGRVFS